MGELTDREIDSLIAEKVMGWELGATSMPHDPRYYWSNVKGPNSGMTRSVPKFSDDRNAAALVLERIAELGLVHPFMHRLIPTKTTSYAEQIFAHMQMSPRQLCEAVLKAVESERPRG